MCNGCVRTYVVCLSMGLKKVPRAEFIANKFEPFSMMNKKKRKCRARSGQAWTWCSDCFFFNCDLLPFAIENVIGGSNTYFVVVVVDDESAIRCILTGHVADFKYRKMRQKLRQWYSNFQWYSNVMYMWVHYSLSSSPFYDYLSLD